MLACAVLAFIAAAPAASALAAPAGAAAAASAPWTIQPSPNATIPGGQLKSVSCSAADACTAVGTNLGPAGVVLDAISCLAVDSCEAVGATFGQPSTVTLAEAWDGTAWTIQPTPNPPVTQSSVLNAVSCTSATSCTAVGQNVFTDLDLIRTLAEVWNGKTWSLRSTPSNVNAGANILSGVSCVTGAGCTAIGATQDEGLVQATLIEAGD